MIIVNIENQTNILCVTKNCSLNKAVQLWSEACHGSQYSMMHHLSTTKLQINQSCLLPTVSEINGKCWLCQEIKDDGILPETCHDHNNHAAAAIFLTRSEWGTAEVSINRDVFSYKEAALEVPKSFLAFSLVVSVFCMSRVYINS